MFDFETFSRLVCKVYEGGLYKLEDVLRVFRCYFQQYEEKTGRPHPDICLGQIRRIIRVMPYISQDEVISSKVYGSLIRQHFETQYRNCDYNINHFFSGRIRQLRWYEVKEEWYVLPHLS